MNPGKGLPGGFRLPPSTFRGLVGVVQAKRVRMGVTADIRPAAPGDSVPKLAPISRTGLATGSGPVLARTNSQARGLARLTQGARDKADSWHAAFHRGTWGTGAALARGRNARG